MSCENIYNARWMLKNHILDAELSMSPTPPTNFTVEDLKVYEHSAKIQGQASASYPTGPYTDVPDIVIDFNFPDELKRVSGASLQHSNLSAGTVRLRCWDNNNQTGNLVYDSGALSVTEFLSIWELDFGTQALWTPIQYVRNIGKFYSWYFDDTVIASGELTISEPTNSDGYLEINDFFLGSWQTTNANFQFGSNQGATDTTEQLLMEDGTIICSTGIKGDFMTADYNALSASDRSILKNELTDPAGKDLTFFMDMFPLDDEASNREHSKGLFVITNEPVYAFNEERSYENESFSWSTNIEFKRK